MSYIRQRLLIWAWRKLVAQIEREAGVVEVHDYTVK